MTTVSKLKSKTINLWFSTLGFGFFGTDMEGNLLPVSKEQYFTRWNGLLSTQILSLDTHQNEILIGTAQGAQLWNSSGTLLKTWTESTHPYTQRVYLDGSQVLIGTYKGLYDGTTKNIYLSPWSVFSMLAKDDTLWVGYDGLQKFDLSTKDITTINSDIGTIYDIVANQHTLYVSSASGLYQVFIEESPIRFEKISPHIGNLLYLEAAKTRPWFSLEDAGLLQPNGKTWNPSSWKQDIQLSAIYAVATSNEHRNFYSFVGGLEGFRVITFPDNTDISNVRIPPSFPVWKPYGMNSERYLYEWKTIHYLKTTNGYPKHYPLPSLM